MDLFENDSEIKSLLNENNSLGFELLSILLFYTSQKNQEAISDNKLALNLIGLIHDFYYDDLRNKMQLNYEERKQASSLLNKRYSDYSNFLKANEPVLVLTRYFINNAFSSNKNDLSIILSSSKYLVECVKKIEILTNNLKIKYSFS